MAQNDGFTAEQRAAEVTLRAACKNDSPIYKAALILARMDKTKVEDADDKLVIMRALRVIHSFQEIASNKSLPKARI